MEEEPPHYKFLRALVKTRDSWESDKQFTKIFQKLEKGKDLKREEFDRVYVMIRETAQYHWLLLLPEIFWIYIFPHGETTDFKSDERKLTTS